MSKVKRDSDGGSQTVDITEGQVVHVARGVTIVYPRITSCMTVTIDLPDGSRVGAHVVLFVEGSTLPPREEVFARLDQFRTLHPNAPIWVVGALDCWSRDVAPGWVFGAPGEETGDRGSVDIVFPADRAGSANPYDIRTR